MLILKSMLFISWTLCQICLFEFTRVEGTWSSWDILSGEAIEFGNLTVSCIEYIIVLLT
jgi:hypothetical protein